MLIHLCCSSFRTVAGLNQGGEELDDARSQVKPSTRSNYHAVLNFREWVL